MKPLLLLSTVLFSANIFCQSFTCGDTLIDLRDGQKYTTVLIGSDCWFSQNLNYGNFVQSDSLGIIHSQQTNNGIPEKYAQYNDTNNLMVYSGLYEQAELMNYAGIPQGLCPDGWHVSSDSEWQNLVSVAGGSMLSANAGNGANGLKANGTGFGQGAGTNSSGIALLPGGDRDGFGIFYGLNLRYIYWTSTPAGINQAWHYMLWAENDTIQRLSLGTTTTGFSCRCVKDATNGLNEQLLPFEIMIAPNPANSSFMVTSPVPNYTIDLIDLSGRTIHSEKSTTESTTVSRDHFPDGMYMIRITFPNGIQQSQRLVLK